MDDTLLIFCDELSVFEQRCNRCAQAGNHVLRVCQGFTGQGHNTVSQGFAVDDGALGSHSRSGIDADQANVSGNPT